MEVPKEHFDHEHPEKFTPFETRYLPYMANLSDPAQRFEVANQLAGTVTAEFSQKETTADKLKPHQGFIDAYNIRAEKTKKEERRKKSQMLYNENGKRFGRGWEHEGFRKIHDPLRIFEKKGNYEDLAWKVYNEVDDSNVYLKVLYFPKITSDDFHNLLDNFEDEYKYVANKGRVSWLVAGGTALFTWALAYQMRFKFSTFLLSSAAAFAVTKYSLSVLSHKRMQKNLNNYAANISKNYPEIKFSRVEYIKSSDLAEKNKMH